MDVHAVVEAIESGSFDDDLGDVVRAVQERFLARGSYWRVEWDGLVVTEEDVTIAEAEMIEAAINRQFRYCDPAASATHGAAVLSAAFMERRGMKLPAVKDMLRHITARDLARACSKYVAADDDPKEGSAGPTTTLTGS